MRIAGSRRCGTSRVYSRKPVTLPIVFSVWDGPPGLCPWRYPPPEAIKPWLAGQGGVGLLACPLDRTLHLLFFVTQSSCSAFGSVSAPARRRRFSTVPSG